MSDDQLDLELDDSDDFSNTGVQTGAGNITGTWNGGQVGYTGTITASTSGPQILYHSAGYTSLLNQLQQSQDVVRTNVCYVIIPDGGPCLELQEEQVMTPREMLNLCKFINLAQHATSEDISVNWSQLTTNLGIARHFKPGKNDYMDYDVDSEVLYVYLFDEEV